jgi:hypothetical protein
VDLYGVGNRTTRQERYCVSPVIRLDYNSFRKAKQSYPPHSNLASGFEGMDFTAVRSKPGSWLREPTRLSLNLVRATVWGSKFMD